jgi:thymidylate synthase (FAD)
VRIDLLDHGYVSLIESWGADARIIEAARMSTAKGFIGWGPQPCKTCVPAFGQTVESTCPECCGRGVPGDEKLLRFLWENKHATPFEFGGLVIEVQAPIFVFREWHRHRTQSYNEMSARYTPLPDVNYLPTAERCLMVGGKNRQAGTVAGADELTHESALEWLGELADVYEHAQRVYESGLRRGIPKELARCPVPVGRYSRMRASANLRNWLAFLTLRQAPNAQQEIRDYANAVGEMVAKAFPRTWELFSEARS